MCFNQKRKQMKTSNHPVNKVIMWNKVKEMYEVQHLSKSKISEKLEINWRTVDKYLAFTEDEMLTQLTQEKNYRKLLDPYYGFIHELLNLEGSISAASIEDKLLERYSDFPVVSSKTVYNYVMYVRLRENIPKHKKVRLYEEQEEVPYGSWSQVDFGEHWMRKESGGRIKVHIFAMVLSRSRYKYLCFQTKHFDTSATNGAHIKAFEYFEGITEQLLYDQDKVLINSENLGDVMLTADFNEFKKAYKFKAVFCRKSDPETKGKIENVIGYIKYNFLAGRLFKSIDQLNQEGLEWLDRRANGKVHNKTRLIPKEEWEKEKQYLNPLPQVTKPAAKENDYAVKSTHVVMYKSNSYSVPFGTYQGQGTKVYLRNENDKILLYDMNHNLIAEHVESHDKGKQVFNTDHRRDKSQKLQLMQTDVLSLLPESANLEEFIQKIKQDKPRHLRDHLQKIRDGIEMYDGEIVEWALNYCIEGNLLNAERFLEALKFKQKQGEKEKLVRETKTRLNLISSVQVNQSLFTPSRSSIEQYEQILALK